MTYPSKIIETIDFVITPLPTKRSITCVLMRAEDHFPLPKNVTKLTKDVQQYNAIVHYIEECGYGVSGTNMTEYAVNSNKIQIKSLPGGTIISK